MRAAARSDPASAWNQTAIRSWKLPGELGPYRRGIIAAHAPTPTTGPGTSRRLSAESLIARFPSSPRPSIKVSIPALAERALSRFEIPVQDAVREFCRRGSRSETFPSGGFSSGIVGKRRTVAASSEAEILNLWTAFGRIGGPLLGVESAGLGLIAADRSNGRRVSSQVTRAEGRDSRMTCTACDFAQPS